MVDLQEICRQLIDTAHSLGIKVVDSIDPEEYQEFLEGRIAVVEQQKKELQEAKEAKLLRTAWSSFLILVKTPQFIQCLFQIMRLWQLAWWPDWKLCRWCNRVKEPSGRRGSVAAATWRSWPVPLQRLARRALAVQLWTPWLHLPPPSFLLLTSTMALRPRPQVLHWQRRPPLPWRMQAHLPQKLPVLLSMMSILMLLVTVSPQRLWWRTIVKIKAPLAF